MVRKAQQKRKARKKAIPSSSEGIADCELIVPDDSAQLNNGQKPPAELGSDENTAEKSSYTIEMAKFSCAVSCVNKIIYFYFKFHFQMEIFLCIKIGL